VVRFRELFKVLVLLVSLSYSRGLFADCAEVVAKLSAISKWSISEKNLKLTAKDIFPKEYLHEVESTKGPFYIDVHHHPERGYVSITGKVKSRVFVRVKLIQDKRDQKSLIVDELNLQDPLKEDEGAPLNPDQTGKGLPLQVFRHVKEQLFEIAQAGNYTEIRTNSQQHYAVVMLYRRMVGMEPADESSKKVLDYLDGLYSFSRKELPEELKPKDIEEFTRWLGTGGLDPAGLTDSRVVKIHNYFETGAVDPSFTVLKNKKGEAIGALFKDGEKARSNIVFFDMTSPTQPKILNWYGLAFSHQLELVKKF